MTRNMLVAILLVMAFFVSPVFAGGNLTVTGHNLASNYTNTKTVTNMLNLSLDVTPGAGDGTVNITVINVTIGGNATIGNISSVNITSSTGSFIASNTTNSTANAFTIYIPNGIFVNASTNSSIIIAINLSSYALARSNISVNVTTNASIVTATTGDNITITNTTSTESKIQDVHATASISPRYVDTNVTNQSLTYTINTTGNDKFNSTSITIPAGYTVVNVTYVGDSNGSLTALANIGFSAYLINVNYTSGYNGTLTINFTVNTNTSTVNSTAFISTISGSNLTSVATDVSGTYTSVTTQQLPNVTNIAIIKSAAYANGTDYWEFNFTINITASVNGSLQFKMSNWTNPQTGQNISLTACSTNCATLRDSNNPSNVINVTQNYDTATGVSFTGGGIKNVILKMIIPQSTNIYSSWLATYSMLFRSAP